MKDTAKMMPQIDRAENEWFLEKIHPYEGLLRSWLKNKFPSLENVDDVIQEAYLNTLKRKRKKPIAYPKAFLFASARNLCIDSIRRNVIVQFEAMGNEDVHLRDRSKGIPEGLEAREDFGILCDAISALPKKCRRVFTLRKVYGMSLKQISQELGISVKTVETQITIGIQK